MPIYEYACDDCGKLCEVIQKVTDEPISTCPECSGQMHKLISHTSFILKGTGWYVTDYANKSRSTTASQKKEEKKSSEKPDTSVKTTDSST